MYVPIRLGLGWPFLSSPSCHPWAPNVSFDHQSGVGADFSPFDDLSSEGGAAFPLVTGYYAASLSLSLLFSSLLSSVHSSLSITTLTN